MRNLRKIYRHKSNPLEKQFHDNFILECDKDIDFSRIAFPTVDGLTPVEFVNEREIQIMINTIQWLGSPVGRSFLRRNGFEYIKEK